MTEKIGYLWMGISTALGLTLVITAGYTAERGKPAKGYSYATAAEVMKLYRSLYITALGTLRKPVTSNVKRFDP